MPHFALHVLLASRVVEAQRGPGLDPAPTVDLEDPAQRNAFLNGAIGPDMGFYPGGEHLLSLAAHVVRAGDLARALSATAKTPEQRAFASGWLTHMLGDVLIHPIINRAAWQLLEREETASTIAWHHNAHLRVELGLDAAYVARYRSLRKTRLRPFFDLPTARWITAAFRQVYGVDFETTAVLRSHQQVVRYHRPLLFLERLIAINGAARHPLRSLIRRFFLTSSRVAKQRLGPHCSVAGFLNTVRPGEDVVTAVDLVVDEFPTAFAGFTRRLLETGINYTLDLGRIDIAGQPTAEGIIARRRLAALRKAQAGAAEPVAASA